LKVFAHVDNLLLEGKSLEFFHEAVDIQGGVGVIEAAKVGQKALA
jgi:hypothetical protein